MLQNFLTQNRKVVGLLALPRRLKTTNKWAGIFSTKRHGFFTNPGAKGPHYFLTNNKAHKMQSDKLNISRTNQIKKVLKDHINFLQRLLDRYELGSDKKELPKNFFTCVQHQNGTNQIVQHGQVDGIPFYGTIIQAMFEFRDKQKAVEMEAKLEKFRAELEAKLLKKSDLN